MKIGEHRRSSSTPMTKVNFKRSGAGEGESTTSSLDVALKMAVNGPSATVVARENFGDKRHSDGEDGTAAAKHSVSVHVGGDRWEGDW